MASVSPDPPRPLVEFERAFWRSVELQWGTYVAIQRLNGYEARREWRSLLRKIPNQRRLEHFGRKIYSQNDEDGIIAEILRRLNATPKSGKFVEVGVGRGLECNTHFLLHRGFSGLWLESSKAHVAEIQERFRAPLRSGHLGLKQALVTAENINQLLAPECEAESAFLLSIDIDGNDFWLWKAIGVISPAVVVIEYNAKFPPPISIAQPYRPDLVWRGTDYFGASITAMVRLAETKGYNLVACSITGVNAFFVRKDLVASHFPYDLTAENLYHPCRYYLTDDCFRVCGHPTDFGPYVTVGHDLSEL